MASSDREGLGVEAPDQLLWMPAGEEQPGVSLGLAPWAPSCARLCRAVPGVMLWCPSPPCPDHFRMRGCDVPETQRGLQEVKTQTNAGQSGKQQLTTGRRVQGSDGQHCHESEHAPSREALHHGQAPGRTFSNRAVLAGNQQRGALVRAFSSAAVPGHL